MQKLEDRPPFVTFETRSIEDREATIAAGHYVGRDVDYALITPAGSKDQIERVVSEWFQQLKLDLARDKVPAGWVNAFHAWYKAFKDGKEPPVSGYPLINWPGLSPSEVKTLLSLNLRAVEDVAMANEETLQRIGMGSRALKQRAIDFLSTAKDVGAVAEELTAQRQRADAAEARAQALESKVEVLVAQVSALAQAQPGAHHSGGSSSDDISADDLGLGTKL